MTKNKVALWGTIGAISLILAGLFSTVWYYATLPERVSQHETLVFGQSSFAPGSEAAMRVVVRDTADGLPLAGAMINVRAESSGDLLFSGSTDNDSGTADLQLQMPDFDGTETLIIETESDLGSDQFEQPITLTRNYKILLITDKPLYQPGQTIKLRAVALSTFDQRAADSLPLEIVISDGKGNKVFRQSLETDPFGVVATEFRLADQVNSGVYKIEAIADSTTSERSVTVENYSLPKFDLNLSTERAYYAPGETVRGTLQSDYFFGEPVANSDVRLEGFTFDFERIDTFEMVGTTDANGSYSFEFELPAFFAGTEFDQGLGRFYIQASVIDQAQQTEQKSISFPVSERPIVIEAIPEGGQPRGGVENILYILTSYPDGSPAETEITLIDTMSGDATEISTGRFGLAQATFTPDGAYAEFIINATDRQGNAAEQDFYFEGRWEEGALLMRTDAPVYRVGETANVTVLTDQLERTVYLDIVRNGQTLNTRSIDVVDGVADAAIDLSPNLYGTLELHAYVIDASGRIVRDTRLIIVDQANELEIALNSDQDVYRPGDSANLNVNVSDQNGGVEAAVGLAVVDEAVFALAEQDPGFAKLYFLLEEELLTPKFQLKGFSVPDLMRGEPLPTEPGLDTAQQETARATLADLSTTALDPFSLQVNTRTENIAALEGRQLEALRGLANGTLWGLGLIGLILTGVAGWAAWRNERLGRALLVSLGLLIATAILTAAIAWINSFFYWYWDEVLILISIGVVALLLIIFTVRYSSWRITWGLMLVGAALVGLLFYIDSINWRILSGQPPILALIFLIVGLGLGFLLQTADFVIDRKFGRAILAFLFTFPILALGFVAVAEAGFFMQPQVVMMEAEMVGANVDFAMDEVMEDAEVVEEATAFVEKSADRDDSEAGSGSSGPRLREYFPETMYWLPDGTTDENGNLDIEMPVADSITTWRLTALAHTQAGQIGSATGSLKVFQDFFIDLNLPGSLTQGDEVSIPVGVFNYLETAQSVTLELQQEPWFTLLDEQSKTLEIGPNEITVVYFRVRADQFGTQPFQVTAIGDQQSDAIKKLVRVFPNGREYSFSESDRLSADAPLNTTVNIPAEAIAGTQSLAVKIYPGLTSQVVEGLDSILRMPNGCFEQTSATTYPNILVLDYLRSTEQISPEVEIKAEEYITLGYQRLISFEVGNSGGFSLFGDPPPAPMLTAFGIQEFTDMSRVHSVDPSLVPRMQEWIIGQQNGNGSWSNPETFSESTITGLNRDISVTAYVVWGLADSGAAEHPATEAAVDYLLGQLGSITDTYEMALVANGLISFDLNRSNQLSAATKGLLDRLAERANSENGAHYWQTDGKTVMGGLWGNQPLRDNRAGHARLYSLRHLFRSCL